jgi:hypothetical protein
MVSVQAPNRKVCRNSFPPETRAESDAPEVWPELDDFVEGKEHAIRIVRPLSKAFCQDYS